MSRIWHLREIIIVKPQSDTFETLAKVRIFWCTFRVTNIQLEILFNEYFLTMLHSEHDATWPIDINLQGKLSRVILVR